MNTVDIHNLGRFIDAQEIDFTVALTELKRSQKKSHWIWYIFPQVAGLGSSPMAQHYAIKCKEEGLAYLKDELLGVRLIECCEALLEHQGSNIEDIMGFPDDLKLRSSMTLFATIQDGNNVFQRVLDVFYAGKIDEKSVALIDLH